MQHGPLCAFFRFCLKVHFSDKKPKKARFSGFEPPTTDTTDGTSEVPVFLIAAFSDNGLRERKGTTGITQRCYYHCPVLCLFETAVISTEMNRQVARGPGKKNRDLQSTRLLTPGPV